MTTLTSIHPLPYRLKIHLSADSAKSSLAYPNMSATMLPLTGWCWARIVLQAITPGGALGANRFHKCSLTCATNSQNMAEPAGSDESPWAKGEAAFKRCVTHTLACSRKSLVFYCLSACLDLKDFSIPQSSRFISKANSKYFDPCQEAASRSIKCLHRNAGDRQLCTDYFQ